METITVIRSNAAKFFWKSRQPISQPRKENYWQGFITQCEYAHILEALCPSCGHLSVAESDCVDIYNDFDSSEIRLMPKSVQMAWATGGKIKQITNQ